MSGVRDGVGHSCQISITSDSLKVARGFEVLPDQHQIDLSPRVMHRQHVLEETSIRIVVEVVRTKHHGDIVASRGVDDDTAEHTHLGLETEGWLAVQDFGSDGSRSVRRIGALNSRHVEPPP